MEYGNGNGGGAIDFAAIIADLHGEINTARK